LTVIVNPVDPSITDVGEILVVIGVGLSAVIVNVCAFDVPPPGVGFVTVIDAVPGVARSEVKIEALNSVALTKVVVLADPLKLTAELATKFVPFTVIVNPVEPSITDVGEILVVVGTGLVIVSVCAFDVPPPGVGLKTVIDVVPAVAISESNIVAVS
jgi:hypothetical protein